MEINIEKTQWLHSVASERVGLRLHTEIVIQLYSGERKKLNLRYTSYTIGSDSKCDLVLADPFVSKLHAKIILNANGNYEVENLQSKNGVFLNGTRIEKAILPQEGALQLGRSHISWQAPASAIAEQMETGILAVDPAMRDLLQQVRVAASSSLSILILGETGTGKEMVAKLIHKLSSRSSAAFVLVNGATAVGSLVDSELFGHKRGAYTGSDTHRAGALLSANGGTLFIDELGELNLETQAKLLRAIEYGEVKSLGSDKILKSDFRLVCATNRSLERYVKVGKFRIDLYYRVANFVLRIPPLRERPQDILVLAKFFAESKGYFLVKECDGPLLSYSWPGNVRELKAVIERAVLSAKAKNQGHIQPKHLIFSGTLSLDPEIIAEPRSLKEMEKMFIIKALERNHWSRVAAAKELHIARSTLFEKMRRFDIKDLNLLQH